VLLLFSIHADQDGASSEPAGLSSAAADSGDGLRITPPLRPITTSPPNQAGPSEASRFSPGAAVFGRIALLDSLTRGKYTSLDRS